MILPLISFGKKIPVAKCQIKDSVSNKMVNATIVEYDCNDISDIDEIKNLEDWTYSKCISDSMARVYKTKKYLTPSYSYFAIEDNKKDIVGIAATKSIGDQLVLDSIESSPNKEYKYVGKNMMTFLKNFALANGLNKIYVPIAVESARDFYIRKCGFKPTSFVCSLILNCHHAPKLNQEITSISEN